MLRYLRLLFIAATGLALLVLALANRAAVPVRLLPEDVGALLGLDHVWELPLFLVILGSVALGVLIGFVWEWFRESKHRSAATHHRREAARLEREVGRLRDKTDERKDDVLALLEASERPR